MPNIVLTRIDNRLVHGQVATQWCGAIGANLILVANDEEVDPRYVHRRPAGSGPGRRILRHFLISS